MVKFLSIIFFWGGRGFLQFLLGFQKFPFFCVTLYFSNEWGTYDYARSARLFPDHFPIQLMKLYVCLSCFDHWVLRAI